MKNILLHCVVKPMTWNKYISLYLIFYRSLTTHWINYISLFWTNLHFQDFPFSLYFNYSVLKLQSSWNSRLRRRLGACVIHSHVRALTLHTLLLSVLYSYSHILSSSSIHIIELPLLSFLSPLSIEIVKTSKRPATSKKIHYKEVLKINLKKKSLNNIYTG